MRFFPRQLLQTSAAWFPPAQGEDRPSAAAVVSGRAAAAAETLALPALVAARRPALRPCPAASAGPGSGRTCLKLPAGLPSHRRLESWVPGGPAGFAPRGQELTARREMRRTEPAVLAAKDDVSPAALEAPGREKRGSGVSVFGPPGLGGAFSGHRAADGS